MESIPVDSSSPYTSDASETIELTRGSGETTEEVPASQKCHTDPAAN
jgi:hypothetical protein